MKSLVIALIALVSACASHREPEDYQTLVEKEFERRYADFQDCYDFDRAKATAGTPSGKITFLFWIGPEGKASNARISENTLNRPEAEACFFSVLKTMRFTPHDRVKVESGYSFRFDP